MQILLLLLLCRLGTNTLSHTHTHSGSVACIGNKCVLFDWFSMCVVSDSSVSKDESHVILINAFPISLHLDTNRFHLFHSLILIPFVFCFSVLIYRKHDDEWNTEIPLVVFVSFCRLNAWQIKMCVYIRMHAQQQRHLYVNGLHCFALVALVDNDANKRCEHVTVSTFTVQSEIQFTSIISRCSCGCV